MSKNPKRDAKIVRLLRCGFAAKEVAFKMKLQSAGVVYELLRRNNLKACVLRRESRLQKHSQKPTRDNLNPVR
ncbi:MAG: hypothetical protein WC421_07645 [Elusimicrobiales bacterium]